MDRFVIKVSAPPATPNCQISITLTQGAIIVFSTNNIDSDIELVWNLAP